MNLLKRASMLIAACSMMFATAVAATERIAGRIATFVLDMFPAIAPRLVVDGPDMVLRTDRPSLAASLLESLRHEKGVPRFGAARNI